MPRTKKTVVVTDHARQRFEERLRDRMPDIDPDKLLVDIARNGQVIRTGAKHQTCVMRRRGMWIAVGLSRKPWKVRTCYPMRRVPAAPSS